MCTEERNNSIHALCGVRNVRFGSLVLLVPQHSLRGTV